MTARHRRIFVRLAVSALFMTTTAVARAQLPSEGQARAIGVGTVGGGAAVVGVGVCFTVQDGQSLRGCAGSAQGGLQLQSQSDQPAVTLAGEVVAINPGDQVRVSRKKQKNEGAGIPIFLVDKVTKDYGACKVQPASALTVASFATTESASSPRRK